MSFVKIGLFLLAVAGVYGIFYLSYRLFRSAKLDDEETERKLRQEEADRAAAIAAKYPGAQTQADKDKLKKLLDRSL
jgi:hypothetical protein